MHDTLDPSTTFASTPTVVVTGKSSFSCYHTCSFDSSSNIFDIDHAKVPETKSNGMLILDCQESGDTSPTVNHSGKAEYHMASSNDQTSKSFMLFFLYHYHTLTFIRV